MTRLVASAALEERSEELEEESEAYAEVGVDEVMGAAALGEVARDLTLEGITETSMAAAELGASAEAAQAKKR